MRSSWAAMRCGVPRAVAADGATGASGRSPLGGTTLGKASGRVRRSAAIAPGQHRTAGHRRPPHGDAQQHAAATGSRRLGMARHLTRGRPRCRARRRPCGEVAVARFTWPAFAPREREGRRCGWCVVVPDCEMAPHAVGISGRPEARALGGGTASTLGRLSLSAGRDRGQGLGVTAPCPGRWTRTALTPSRGRPARRGQALAEADIEPSAPTNLPLSVFRKAGESSDTEEKWGGRHDRCRGGDLGGGDLKRCRTAGGCRRRRSARCPRAAARRT